MHSIDLALLDFAFVCVSGLYHPYMSSKVTKVRMFRYTAAFDTRWISFSQGICYLLDIIRSFIWKYKYPTNDIAHEGALN